MIIYTLYVKTHKVTGLKYLGQTTKDAHFYKGSGVDWKHHLREHGNDVITEILYRGDDREEMKILGRHYSDLWNVMESSEWANRIPETGGGSTPSEETRKLLSERLTGIKKPTRTTEHKKKLSDSSIGKSKPKTSEGLKKWYSTNPNREDAINKQANSLKNWCKNNPEKASSRAVAVWDSIYKKHYEEYKSAVELAVSGKGEKTIKRVTGMYLKTESVKKLRDGTHRIFTLFPILKQLL